MWGSQEWITTPDHTLLANANVLGQWALELRVLKCVSFVVSFAIYKICLCVLSNFRRLLIKLFTHCNAPVNPARFEFCSYFCSIIPWAAFVSLNIGIRMSMSKLASEREEALTLESFQTVNVWYILHVIFFLSASIKCNNMLNLPQAFIKLGCWEGLGMKF